MSKIRGKIEVLFSVDTDEYPIPSDGRLMLQIREDVQEALESSMDITINNVKITGVVGKHEEVRDND